jgi:hypothetical protein
MSAGAVWWTLPPLLPTITLAMADRDLHSLVAQRHDRHAARGFHPDGEEQGISNTRILLAPALRPSA